MNKKLTLPLPLGLSLKNYVMCDELEILNREIERLLQSSSVEESTKNNSDCLQTSLTDSDVITGSDSGAKYELEQVFNVMRYSRVS